MSVEKLQNGIRAAGKEPPFNSKQAPGHSTGGVPLLIARFLLCRARLHLMASLTNPVTDRLMWSAALWAKLLTPANSRTS